MKRIVDSIPIPTFTTQHYPLPTLRIIQNKLSLGLKKTLAVAPQHGIVVPHYNRSTLLTMEYKKCWWGIHGQHIQPIHAQKQPIVTLYGSGTLSLALHDLDAIHDNQIVPKCLWLVTGLHLSTSVPLVVKETGVLPYEPLLPVRSNPKRHHRYLISVWNTPAPLVIKSRFEMNFDELLAQNCTLSGFGFFSSSFDSSTSQVYKV
jgi:hypothetical protein